jgi:hypothetical protein
MRRLALLGLLLLLPGCQGTGTFLGDTFTLWGVNPNAPVGDSENIDRVRGRPVNLPPLTSETGNIWPPPNQPIPSLYDIQKQEGINPNNPPPSTTPALPAHRQPRPNELPSSTPPTSNAPGLPNVPGMPVLPAQPPVPPPPGPGAGTTVQTPNGPVTTTGPIGGTGMQTTTQPGGGQGILIPNGNGTSTLIGPNGSVTTVPTPK